MAQLVRDFEVYLRVRRGRSPLTVKRYASVLDAFVDFLAATHKETVDLESVDKTDIVKFLSGSVNHEPSKATWNASLGALRAFYGFLYKDERIAANPALRIERVKVNGKEPQPLSLDEMLRLVDTVRHRSPDAYKRRNVAIVQVLFHCALRVAELVSLDIDQVDFENRVFRDVRTKGDKRLSACFNDLVAEALEQWLRTRAEMNSPATERALFLSDRRTRLSVRTVQMFLSTYGAHANIGRPVTPHLLRHSSVTELVDMGVPLRVVQEMCNHSSITTTQRYAHVNAGARRKAVDALGASWKKRVDGLLAAR